MTTRDKVHVRVYGLGIVGSMRVERPYVKWTPDLAPDGDSEGQEFEVEELKQYQDKITLSIPIEEIERYIHEYRGE